MKPVEEQTGIILALGKKKFDPTGLLGKEEEEEI